MNVRQLRKILEGFDDSDLVVLAADTEGNGYMLLDGYSGDYVYSSKYGEIYERSDKEAPKNSRRCIILWPGD